MIGQYSISVYNKDGLEIYQSNEETYDKDSPEFVNATIKPHLLEHTRYTAEVSVSTDAGKTTRRLALVSIYTLAVISIKINTTLDYKQ